LFFKIGFLEVGFWDILDVILVSILFYQIYKLLKGSLAFNILIGFLIVFLLYRLVDFLNMNLLSTFLNQFIAAGFLAIFIIFQPEIRRFLLIIGRRSTVGIGNKSLRKLFSREVEDMEHMNQYVLPLQKTFERFSKKKIGALIVFTPSKEEYFFSKTGVVLNSEISVKLIESIFNKNSPLHDGAVIISQDKIYAAAAVLPISEKQNLPKNIGMRHRAAIGISEKIQCIVFVISEETGKISYASKGKLHRNLNQKMIIESLQTALTM